MARSERLSRQPAARTGPVRNPVVATPRGPGSGPMGPGEMFRGMVGGSLDAARRAALTSTAAVQGAVESSVSTAYTVIDGYMNRGYTAASLRNRSNGARAMSDESGAPKNPYDPGSGRGESPWGAPPGGPMGLWMAPWLQMMRFWTDAMTSFAAPAQEWASPFVPPAAPWGGSPAVPISVRVKSKRAAKVTVDVHPGSDHQRLSLEPLRHTSRSGVKEIGSVGITTSHGAVTVDVEVADRQSAGEYVGVVRDGHGYRRGEVRLELSD